MGTEFKNKGAAVQLAPGLNLMRIAEDGRAFEYISGEDPILGYHMANSIVRGIQDGGVMANAKHWVNNN